jgi:DNA-directed RNA polymerase II subunit RPB3
VAFEYDPYNKLRHTTYWYETDVRAEWPLSENAKEEEPPRDGEPFDYNANARKFYMEVETDGSLGPQEVIMKVCPKIPSNLLSTDPILTVQGLAELQRKLANLILGLKTQPELDMLPSADQTVQANGHAVAGASAPLPSTALWGGGEPMWNTQASPMINGTGAGAAATWGSSSPAHASGAEWNAGSAAGVWGNTSPNAAGGASSSWSAGGATGWASPSQQRGGWNV